MRRLRNQVDKFIATKHTDSEFHYFFDILFISLTDTFINFKKKFRAKLIMRIWIAVKKDDKILTLLKNLMILENFF